MLTQTCTPGINSTWSYHIIFFICCYIYFASILLILLILLIFISVFIHTLFYSFLFLVMSLTGEGNGTPLQYSCLENPMNGGAWWATVHGVAENRTRLCDFTFTFHFHALEKEMATHSSVLAWRIPGTGEPGGLPSMGSHRVGHNWSDLAAAADVFNNQIFKSHITLLTAILMSTISSCTRQDVWGPGLAPKLTKIIHCSLF